MPGSRQETRLPALADSLRIAATRCGRIPWLLSLGVAVLDPFASCLAQGSQPDPRRLEAQARQRVAEGKALEQQGKLAEAKDRYVDAEGLAPSSEALGAILRISERQEQQVESLLAEAHRLFDSGKFADSAAHLEQALDIQPLRPVLHYDLALCYLKLGDRANAAEHLDPAVGWLEGTERTELLQLRSTVLMGTRPEAPFDARSDASRTLATFNQSYLQEDRDPGDSRAAGGSLCAQTTQLAAAFPANPAVLFNSAKCAAQEGRAGDVAKLLAEYTRQAPDALDRSDAAAVQRVWTSLASLAGESGQTVRGHYAAASRYLDYRRYNLALGEYQAAARALPDLAQTQWELAVLYEAFGDTATAAEYFTRFQQLEPLAERKADADSHLSTLQSRRALYDANVSEAESILGALMRASLGIDSQGERRGTRLSYMQWRWASQQYKDATRATAKQPQPYVMRQLTRAREDLLAATVLFPLGAEANELLAIVDLQGDAWPEAYMSYDAVASQSLPVSFYAQLTTTRDSDTVHAAKVEIGADAVRMIYLSSYDTNREIAAPPSRPAGTDRLGNLVISSVQPPDLQAEGLTIPAADLKGVETDQSSVVLKQSGQEIRIAPLNMLTVTPFAFGAARNFGNAYTKLFARYLGYTQAELGTEGLTAGEKFRVGFLVARAAMPPGMLGIGPAAAYASAMRAARVTRAARRAAGSGRLAQASHELQAYASIKHDLRLAKAGTAVADIATGSPIDTAALEQLAADQRQTLEAMVFKVIPTHPAAAPFRDRF